MMEVIPLVFHAKVLTPTEIPDGFYINDKIAPQNSSLTLIMIMELPYFMMISPSKHSSKFYCLMQRIMGVWRGQNNANSPKVVLKPV